MAQTNDFQKKAVIVAYVCGFLAMLGAGVGLICYTFWQITTQLTAGDSGRGTLLRCGYSVIAAGVLICLIIALIRWRSVELDDARRPAFTAGVAVLAIGAAMMVSGALFR